MPLPPYKSPARLTTPWSRTSSKVIGKSVIVTGGANGMGEECVRQFVAAGAFVTIGDVNDRGTELEKELNAKGKCCVFVKCDIRDWEQQKAMFQKAKDLSPSKSVDIVIANAGISRSSGDSLWNLDDPNSEPTKPDLNIVDVNLRGSLYTWKLAHGGWIDSPGNWEYTSTKYGLHGFMRTARRNSWEQGIRIVYVAPCWIKSAIRTAEYEKWLMDRGVEFGEQEDVGGCMMRVACDKSINGRSLMITPRSMAKEGFMDINRDDFLDTPEDAYLRSAAEPAGDH
ncbi:hypothetical protein EV126DRAFT_431674 [Verticillium dahliae]|nr:hypothetical protein EV126DRAFT_431674 [Verticillium dahliae]